MTTLQFVSPSIPAPVVATVPAVATVSVPRSSRRITPNLFAVSFGLAGLAQTWTVASRGGSVPAPISDILWLIAAAVWLITLVAYLRSVVAGHRRRTELSDQVFGPFVSVPAIVGMLLAGGLDPYAHQIAVLLYILCLAVALALAGRLIAIWALDDTPSSHWHPGYYLPSVGAPLVGSAEASMFGNGSLARLLFGVGLMSWVLIGGILLHHLVGQQRLPQPLMPTMAILLAPPIVAGNAWFGINGGRIDSVSLGLAGYALLMAIVQVGLIPAYRTVPFGPGWWSYSFPLAASTAHAIIWLRVEHTDHQAVWTWLLLAAATAFIGFLAVRTVAALVRGDFLPQPTVSGLAHA